MATDKAIADDVMAVDQPAVVKYLKKYQISWTNDGETTPSAEPVTAYGELSSIPEVDLKASPLYQLSLDPTNSSLILS